MRPHLFSINLTAVCALLIMSLNLSAQPSPQLPASKPFIISAGWQLEDVSNIKQSGEEISQAGFQSKGWLAATVPGTVLTSMVNDKVYPEPLWGENNRPERIPESLARTSYWYRTTFVVPESYKGENIWLNFDGVNYSAQVYVNGKKVGQMQGAFIRGIFNISSVVQPGKTAVLAVLVSPQPHPGDPIEHTIKNGMGHNGGITAIDGPTFLCTIGWDWIPGIRDRNTGIWQKVFLSSTGPVMIKAPLVTTDLPLPKLNSADITIQTTLENISDQPQAGILKGKLGDLFFQKIYTLAPHSSKIITLDPKLMSLLHIVNPKLWCGQMDTGLRIYIH
jgi:hypothetical protein